MRYVTLTTTVIPAIAVIPAEAGIHYGQRISKLEMKVDDAERRGACADVSRRLRFVIHDPDFGALGEPVGVYRRAGLYG